MYIAFIGLLLEYASDVWDGCTVFQVDVLEKFQLHAARIVTGLPIISSRESLYLETGWEPLSNRRETSKLTTMFKVHNNFAPTYVKDIFTSKRGTISNYTHEILMTIPFQNVDLKYLTKLLFLILLGNGTL
jgi:hypothetical protein